MLDLQNKEGIHKLPKGILYEVLAAGSGSQHPGPRRIVTCDYKGCLINEQSLTTVGSVVILRLSGSATLSRAGR